MPASLAIHRLSARTPARAQPVAARLALQALGADLEDALPRGLPPQSLLWLRRLQLQAPEAALLRPAPPAWRQDWIAAGRQQFDAALAQAARPALGPVPESAPAVLFADAAEMLACLALAAQAGQLDRWWWRGLLGRAWPQWPRAWGQRPEAQAGARRLLARVGQGGVLPFAEAAVRVATADVAAPPPQREAGRTHRFTPGSDVVVPPVAALDVRETAARAASSEAAVSAGASPAAGMAKPDLPPVVAAPAASRTDARPPVEHPVARRFDQPRVVDIEQAAQRPRAAAGEEAPASAAQRKGPVPPQPQPRESMPAEATGEPPSSSVAATAPHATTGTAAAPSRPLASPPLSTPAASPLARTETEATTPQSPAQRPTPARRARPASPSVPATEPPLPTQPAMPYADPAPDNAWPWPQALSTRQAPLLFIVNALLEDGLYPDFTRPRDPGLPVPLWALLTTLSRTWRLPPDALQEALAERTPDWIAPDALPAAPGAAAGPWPAWLPAYARSLRRRLCQRLARRGARWPQALVLAQPARLWLSEAEWVAEFDLSSHDVAWRLAGLDRDPGWLPSAGISLRFRFV